MNEPENYSAPGDLSAPISQRLMTLDEIYRATDWINEKSTSTNDGCLVCGSPHSIVQPSIVHMPGGRSPYTSEPGWVNPTIVVVCHSCGFTRYFNAIIMGMVDENGGDYGGVEDA